MSRLLPVRLTLFTRANCSLCTEASAVVARALRQIEPRRPQYQTVDIDDPRYKQKWSIYDFDVPVVCPFLHRFRFIRLKALTTSQQLHVDRVSVPASGESTTTDTTTTACVRKLMHRFNADDVKRLINEAADQGASIE